MAESIREAKVRFIDTRDIVLVPQPSQDQLNILKEMERVCECVRREEDSALITPCQTHREVLELNLSSPALAMVSDRFEREDLVYISVDSN